MSLVTMTDRLAGRLSVQVCEHVPLSMLLEFSCIPISQTFFLWYQSQCIQASSNRSVVLRCMLVLSSFRASSWSEMKAFSLAGCIVFS